MDQWNPFRGLWNSRRYDGAWVPVARLGGLLGRSELPVLFPPGNEEAILDRCAEWPFQLVHGARPSSWMVNDGHGNWSQTSSLYPKHEWEGFPLDPLVAYFRRPAGRAWLEPVQGFPLFHEASPTHERGGTIRWHAADEDGRPDEIARWEPRAEGESVGTLVIRRDKLLDFMHDFDRSLAIFVDEIVTTDAVPDGWRDDGREGRRAFRCHAGKVGAGEISALFNAVTIIDRPPQRPFELSEPKEEMVPFLVGLDKNTGERIEAKHPPTEFLTPVYFKEEVLDRYYADPQHYRVEPVLISAGGMWSLRIAHTGDGHIHAWLGDLGRLPRRAQQHWQGHAVAYDGGVPEWRLRRDIHAEFVDAPRDNVIDALREAIRDANGAAEDLAGVQLVKEPDDLNRDRARILHVPFYNSIPAFQEAVQSLAIIVVDNLDKSFLAAVGAPKAHGNLNRLAGWLSDRLEIELDEAKDLIGGLYAVQALRSKTAAHRAGPEAEEALERANVDLERLPDGFRERVERVVESLSALTQAFRAVDREHL